MVRPASSFFGDARPPSQPRAWGPAAGDEAALDDIGRALVEAGIDAVSMANNHAGDMGPAGRETTEATFDSLGLTTYGPIGSIATDTLRQGDSVTVIGLVGFTTYPFAYSLLDIERSAAVVTDSKRSRDSGACEQRRSEFGTVRRARRCRARE